MTEEHSIQNAVRRVLSENGCVIFRINVGKGRTFDGRYFDTGVPVGFSDLFGVRQSDGKAISGRVRPEQKNFIEKMRRSGAVAGICRSTEDAIRLITEDK